MQKEAKLLFLQGSFKNITFLGWQVAQKAVRLSFFSSLYFSLQPFWTDWQKVFACVQSVIAASNCDKYQLYFMDTLTNSYV